MSLVVVVLAHDVVAPSAAVIEDVASDHTGPELANSRAAQQRTTAERGATRPADGCSAPSHPLEPQSHEVTQCRRPGGIPRRASPGHITANFVDRRTRESLIGHRAGDDRKRIPLRDAHVGPASPSLTGHIRQLARTHRSDRREAGKRGRASSLFWSDGRTGACTASRNDGCAHTRSSTTSKRAMPVSGMRTLRRAVIDRPTS